MIVAWQYWSSDGTGDEDDAVLPEVVESCDDEGGEVDSGEPLTIFFFRTWKTLITYSFWQMITVILPDKSCLSKTIKWRNKK